METLTLIAQILGSMVVGLTALDMIIPEKYDKNFMQKLMKKPIIGVVLEKLMSFSVLRSEKKK